MTHKRKLAYLALTVCAVLWGIAPPLVKLALPHTTPFRWLFYRYLFSAPLTLPLLIFYAVKLKPKLKTILLIIALELIGTTAVLASLYTGLKYTSAIEASLISAAAPFFIVLGGILFLKEKQEKNEWFGLFLAFFGTLAITLEPVFSQQGISGSFSLLGNSLILLQNILWAAYLIIIKKAYKKIPKLFVNSIAFWVGLFSFSLLSLLQQPHTPLLIDLSKPLVTFSAIYMAIFGSIAGATLYLYGNNQIEASEASLFSYLQPLVSIPLAMWWLNESLTLPSTIGMLLIIIGVFLAERRPRTSRKKA